MDKYFSCHSCGKCCNSPPNLLLSELEPHYKNFLLATYIKSFYEEEVHFKSVSQLGRMLKVKNPFNLKTMYFDVSFMGYGYESTHNKCPQLLSDGKCAIYNERPNICQIVPANMDLNKAPQYLIDEGCLSDVAKEGYQPIILNNKIQAPYDSLIDSNEQSQKENHGVISTFLTILTNISASFMTPTGINSWRSMDISMMLNTLFLNDKLNKEKAKEILQAQYNKVDTEIKKALTRKNKEERAMTTELKRFLETYEKTLNNFDSMFYKP